MKGPHDPDRSRSSSLDTGFSLIEILMVILLLSVLIFMGAGSMFRQSPRHSLERAIRQVSATISWARYKSIFDERKYRISFSDDALDFEKYDMSEGKWVRTLSCYLDRVNLSANNKPIFHPAGTVSNLVTIIVSNSAGSYKITLAITGRIKTVKL